MSAIARLPADLLARASRRGEEYAWPVDAIARVIAAGRDLGLLNVGGQLQFRFTDATCECPWVAVDTHQSVPDDLAWARRVALSAEVAARDFARLRAEFDFRAEGARAFAEQFAIAEARDEDMDAATCFVWYLRARDE